MKNAEVAHTLRKRGREFGFKFDNLELDYGVAVKRSRQVSGRLTRGVGFLMKKNNIDVHMGNCETDRQRYRFASQTLMAKPPNLKPRTSSLLPEPALLCFLALKWMAKKYLPIVKPFYKLSFPNQLLSLDLELLVLNSPPIWNSYGVDVTIVEMLPRIVPNEDEEISAELAKAFSKRIRLKSYTETRVDGIETTERWRQDQSQQNDGRN